MRSASNILIFLICLGILLGFTTSADPALKEKLRVPPREVEVRGKTPDGPPPIQEQKIILDPFFTLRRNGSRVWVERIIVTLVIAVPKNCLQHDLNSPTLRKKLYSLLQTGEPETTIEAQALSYLNRQVGVKTNAAVQISRSVLIVR
jgi:hypothetical protein